MANAPYPLVGSFLQFGYVTTDIDQAIALFAQRGVTQFRRSYDLTLQVQTGVYATINVALAYAGDTMIELIQPLSDESGFYSAALSSGSSITLHHLCYSVPSMDDWERLKQTIEVMGSPVVKIDDPDCPMRTIYVDPGLGHFHEYLLVDEAGRKMIETVPRN